MRKFARCSNFSSQEENLLISIIKKHKNIIESKDSHTDSLKSKALAWQDIHNEFNSVRGVTIRDVITLKNKYNNMKKRAKSNFAEEKYNIAGSFLPTPVTEVDEEIREMIGNEQNSLLDNDNDSTNSSQHLKYKLSNWVKEKEEKVFVEKKHMEEEHELKIQHMQEKHQKEIEECNLRIQNQEMLLEECKLRMALMKEKHEKDMNA